MAKKTRRKSKSKGDTAQVAASPIEDRAWRARHDYQTLNDAHEIMGDGERMKHVKTHAKEQRERAARISRLEGKEL